MRPIDCTSKSYLRKMAMLESAYTMETEADRNTLLRIINDAPTIDAVPVVHGRWVMDYDCGSVVLQCSLCDEQYWIEDEHGKKPNYCPNCGNPMDLEGE